MRQIARNFPGNLCCSAGAVFFNRAFEIAKAVRRIVKTGNGRIQRICRVIGKQALKMTEALPATVEHFVVFNQVISTRAFNIIIHAPEFSVRVNVIKLAVMRRNQAKRFPGGITTALLNFFAQKTGYRADIANQFLGVCEYCRIHRLQHIMVNFIALFAAHDKGFVDQPCGILLKILIFATNTKLVGNFAYRRLIHYFHSLSG